MDGQKVRCKFLRKINNFNSILLVLVKNLQKVRKIAISIKKVYCT